MEAREARMTSCDAAANPAFHIPCGLFKEANFTLRKGIAQAQAREEMGTTQITCEKVRG